MLSTRDNELLTRVGQGTMMGTFLRRFLIPVLESADLPEPDCDPVEVRLMGEDLVAFLDSTGRVGLIEALCPHRRAPLFYGRNEENGLRCIYHGWKWDVEGGCMEMPTEPPESNFQDKVPGHCLPHPGGRRDHLGLRGAAGQDAGAPAVRVDAGAGEPPAVHPLHPKLQLRPSHGGRHRPAPMAGFSTAC